MLLLEEEEEEEEGGDGVWEEAKTVTVRRVPGFSSSELCWLEEVLCSGTGTGTGEPPRIAIAAHAQM